MSKEKLELRYYTKMWVVVTVTTVFGLGLTVVLNVMHAPPSLGAQIVGGTPPVFVLFCLELISRIPGTSPLLRVARIGATFVVVGLAFYVSYEQQRDFISSLGFSSRHASVYPVIIDGAMVVSTLSLVEVARKVRSLRPLVFDQESTPQGRPLAPVTPEVVQAELAGQRFREAAARMRTDSTVAALNGKPVDAPVFVEPAA